MSDILQHPTLLNRISTALVLIDMQEPFVGSSYNPKSLVSAVVQLVKGCAALGVPIVGTTQYAERMGDTIKELLPALPPGPLHDKMIFDSCGSDGFVTELTQTGAQQILLCGVESHICVNQTAHSLLARGYQVHVVSDAVSSRKESNWAAGLNKMYSSGVIVSTVEMALFELLKSAQDPAFREILNLIK